LKRKERRRQALQLHPGTRARPSQDHPAAANPWPDRISLPPIVRAERAPELAGGEAALLRHAAGLLLGGLQHPAAAAGLGALYTVARLFYLPGTPRASPATA